MGLDSAELVMDIEEAFGITFPDEGLPLKTCGELLDFVLTEMRKRGSTDEQAGWRKLREMISKFVKNYAPEKITRETLS
jgi:hypothetical protein